MDATTRSQMQAQALMRATTGQSFANYGPIIEGFMAKGIPAEQIEPRVNVLTFNAWKAVGRSVKKGEHGVKVLTWVESRKAPATPDGEAQAFKFARTTTVFHISQTEVR